VPRICAMTAVESREVEQSGIARSGAGRSNMDVVKLVRERTGVAAKSASCRTLDLQPEAW
jgi:hypothetical protein